MADIDVAGECDSEKDPSLYNLAWE